LETERFQRQLKNLDERLGSEANFDVITKSLVDADGKILPSEFEDVFDEPHRMLSAEYASLIAVALWGLNQDPLGAIEQYNLASFLTKPRSEYLATLHDGYKLQTELKTDAITEMAWVAPALSRVSLSDLKEILNIISELPIRSSQNSMMAGTQKDLDDFERFVRFAASC